jgi:hypothetical protein
MEKNQKKILENFITEFLPPTENKIKRSGNELEYITRTLDKLFIQNFSFNLSRTEITESLSRLGYQIFKKNGIHDYEVKKIKPFVTGTILDGNSPFFIYFGINPKTVRQLMLITSKLSENANSKKIDSTEKMKIKLEIFKIKTTLI